MYVQFTPCAQDKKAEILLKGKKSLQAHANLC